MKRANEKLEGRVASLSLSLREQLADKDVCVISSAFHSACVLETLASIWHGNMHGYLSSKLTVFLELRSRKTIHIFSSNGGYCVYYPSYIFRNTRGFENWGMSLGYSVT